MKEHVARRNGLERNIRVMVLFVYLLRKRGIVIVVNQLNLIHELVLYCEETFPAMLVG